MIKISKYTRIKDLKCKYCGADNNSNFPKIHIVDLGGRGCKLRCVCGAETEEKERIKSAVNAWVKGEYRESQL